MILIINFLDRFGIEMFLCNLLGFISLFKICLIGMIDILFNVFFFDGKMFLKVLKYLCLIFMVLKCIVLICVV